MLHVRQHIADLTRMKNAVQRILGSLAAAPAHVVRQNVQALNVIADMNKKK